MDTADGVSGNDRQAKVFTPTIVGRTVCPAIWTSSDTSDIFTSAQLRFCSTGTTTSCIYKCSSTSMLLFNSSKWRVTSSPQLKWPLFFGNPLLFLQHYNIVTKHFQCLLEGAGVFQQVSTLHELLGSITKVQCLLQSWGVLHNWRSQRRVLKFKFRSTVPALRRSTRKRARHRPCSLATILLLASNFSHLWKTRSCKNTVSRAAGSIFDTRTHARRHTHTHTQFLSVHCCCFCTKRSYYYICCNGSAVCPQPPFSFLCCFSRMYKVHSKKQ